MTDNDKPDLAAMTQAARLALPFPKDLVKQKQGADYVNHGVVNQRLLGTIGPFGMRIDHIIRGDYDEKITGQANDRRTWPARSNVIVGVALTCQFIIDGKQVEVSEVGTPEGYYMAPHDGERLKKAVSDAIKRCAMRVGVGLNLWSKGAYFLPLMLREDAAPDEAEKQAAADYRDDVPDPDDVHAGLDEPYHDQPDTVDVEAAADIDPDDPEHAAKVALVRDITAQTKRAEQLGVIGEVAEAWRAEHAEGTTFGSLDLEQLTGWREKVDGIVYAAEDANADA